MSDSISDVDVQDVDVDGDGELDGESKNTSSENYSKTLMCFSYACSSKGAVSDRLKYSNKICLPESMLYEIKEMNDVVFPLFFKVKNPFTQYGSVCGVEEFTAPPGVCHIPYQIMNDICVEQGSNVELELIVPPNGDFVKLQFHTSEFSKISNPKAVLEKIMSTDYPVLTCGQTIVLNYSDLNKNYYVDIVETKPTEVIQIINTNLNVDFAEPHDIKNKNNEISTVTSNENSNTENVIIRPEEPFNGPIINDRSELLKKYRQWSNGFIPFSGRGWRLGNE